VLDKEIKTKGARWENKNVNGARYGIYPEFVGFNSSHNNLRIYFFIFAKSCVSVIVDEIFYGIIVKDTKLLEEIMEMFKSL